MPFQVGSVATHDDGQHTGSAKRDVVDGVAGLDGSGFLLAKGAGIQFPRNGTDDVHIYERTSGEEAYAFHRVGADDYTFYIKESNVWKRFQTESMKNVANGIAGLDASGKVPDANLEVPVTGHGAAQHTDITRKIFMPANSGYIKLGESDARGLYPTVRGADTLKQPELNLSMVVPDDFVSFTSVKLLWITTAAAGNMYWQLKADYAAPGEAYSTHGDDPAYGVTATGGANIMNLQEPANALTLTDLAAGDILGFFLVRDGSDGSDTLSAAVDMLGLVFEYTANQ